MCKHENFLLCFDFLQQYSGNKHCFFVECRNNVKNSQILTEESGSRMCNQKFIKQPRDARFYIYFLVVRKVSRRSNRSRPNATLPLDRMQFVIYSFIYLFVYDSLAQLIKKEQCRCQRSISNQRKLIKSPPSDGLNFDPIKAYATSAQRRLVSSRMNLRLFF